jgi:hypothetical protein
MKGGILRVLSVFILFVTLTALVIAEEAKGPLRVHPTNPRYFTDGSGKAIYLTGSHVWGNLQDYGYGSGYRNPPPEFDYSGYLDFMERHNHNFMRMWAWEAPHAVHGASSVDTYWASPMPYQRTGPGKAEDGELKFDVSKFNEAYFDRLRNRVTAAGKRGIYVSVMLFQGWCVFKFHKTHEPWLYHPLHKNNNVNGLDSDPDGNGEGEEVHSLRLPAITRLQEAYIRKVVDSINDLDNVLFEVSNETRPSADTREWEYHVVRYVKQYEATKPKQHPVGITSNSRWNTDVLESSPSDWVSLRRQDSKDMLYAENPPVADGRKVSIPDTDHIGAAIFIKNADLTRRWAWKSFLRGHNPILMDGFGIDDAEWDRNGAGLVAGRTAMGHTLAYARKMDMAATTPKNELSSSSYCLANPGKEYLVYLPEGGTVTVDLTAARGNLAVEWLDTRTGVRSEAGEVTGGGKVKLRPPFEGEAVLYLRSKSE